MITRINLLTLLLPFSLLIAIISLFVTTTAPLQAAAPQAVINVTTTDDAVANDGACSLREAITAANTNAPVFVGAGECGGGAVGFDVINVAAGTYVLTLVGAGENANATGDLDITSEITLRSQNGDIVVIDGNATDRVLHVRFNGDLTLARITIQNGRSGEGGGIFNDGRLELIDSTVQNSVATSRAGGIFSDAPLSIVGSTIANNESTNNGGGIIHRTGTLFIENSTISGNVAGGEGGGIALFQASLSLINSTIFRNDADGGGNSDSIHADSPGPRTVTIHNSIISTGSGAAECAFVGAGTFTVNTTHSLIEGGGCGAEGDASNLTSAANLHDLADNGGMTQTHLPFFDSPAIDAGDASDCEAFDQRDTARPQQGGCDMGAVEAACDDYYPDYRVSTPDSLNRGIICFNATTAAGTVTISMTQSIDLSTELTPIDNTTDDVDLDIRGNEHTLDGQNSVRPIKINNGTTVEIADLTVQNGMTDATDKSGGGIRNAGTLTLRRVNVLSNQTITGTAANNADGPATLPGDGGGVYNGNNGTLTVINSTIADNTTGKGGNDNVDGDSTRGGHGGGIYNLGTLNVIRSTISGNTTGEGGFDGNIGNSGPGGDGGGIYSTGDADITNSTISGNIAGDGGVERQAGNSGRGGDGGGIMNRGTMTLNNVTVAFNARGKHGTQANAGTLGRFGEGGGVASFSVLRVTNSILAVNTGEDCQRQAGSVPTKSHTLIGNTDGNSCGFSNGVDGNFVGVSALLDVLENNGGTTETHALADNSPARDAGDNGTCEDLDQRAAARPVGGTCDMGAVEGIYVPTAVSLANSTAQTGNANIILSVAVITMLLCVTARLKPARQA